MRFRKSLGRSAFLLAVCLIVPVCSAWTEPRESYGQEILDWRLARMDALKGPGGYLNLVALFTLSEGEQSFGFAPKNTHRLTHESGSKRATIGRFNVQGDSVRFSAQPGVSVTHEDAPVSAIELRGDRDVIGAKGPTVLRLGSLSWYVIVRGDLVLLRVRDTESTRPDTFADFDYYPIDNDWRLEATFNAFEEPRFFTVSDVLGQTLDVMATGTLSVDIAGTTYELEVGDEGDVLFVIFGDATNGDTTYGAGRFVYVNKPAAGGKTVLDFNKAYNPPCAFSDFTTCPLPPRGNLLPMPIRAGEKKHRDSH